VASQPDTGVLLNSPDISQPDKRGTSTGHGCPSQPDTGVLRTSELTSEEHLIGAPLSSSFANDAVVAQQESKESGERGSEPNYLEIKKAILASWTTFSAGSVLRHMQSYGPAKTLEVIECAARLGRPNINKVLDTPLKEWSAPQLIEAEYTPELRKLCDEALRM
jgi:hypothetical protein